MSVNVVRIPRSKRRTKGTVRCSVGSRREGREDAGTAQRGSRGGYSILERGLARHSVFSMSRVRLQRVVLEEETLASCGSSIHPRRIVSAVVPRKLSSRARGSCVRLCPASERRPRLSSHPRQPHQSIRFATLSACAALSLFQWRVAGIGRTIWRSRCSGRASFASKPCFAFASSAKSAPENAELSRNGREE